MACDGSFITVRTLRAGSLYVLLDALLAARALHEPTRSVSLTARSPLKPILPGKQSNTSRPLRCHDRIHITVRPKVLPTEISQ